MLIDPEILRWLISGFFIFSGGIISYLLKREIGRMDAASKEEKTRVTQAHDRISQMQLDVAEKYVSKIDLEKQLDTHLSPIRDDMRDIKGDIKSLLQRP